MSNKFGRGHSRMNITCIIIATLATVGTPALAERSPQTMGQDGRVRSVAYNETDVIKVDTNLRVNTAIELGAGERISQVLLGDSESYEVEVLSNRQTISVKPIIARAATNMTVYTNRRAISFYLVEGQNDRPTFRVAVQFPDRTPARTVVASGLRDTGYEYAGDANFRPERVWNDGRNTFFEFRNDTRPSIFRVNETGYEMSMNTASKGRIVRIAGVHSSYSVRIGDEVVCIRHIEGGTTSTQATVAALASREF